MKQCNLFERLKFEVTVADQYIDDAKIRGSACYSWSFGQQRFVKESYVFLTEWREVLKASWKIIQNPLNDWKYAENITTIQYSILVPVAWPFTFAFLSQNLKWWSKPNVHGMVKKEKLWISVKIPLQKIGLDSSVGEMPKLL